MSKSGVFLRESVLDIPQVENLFVTPRAFNFYMSRKSSEEWEKEQSRDNNGLPPCNLDAVEKGVAIHSIDRMLGFENGRSDYCKISDMSLCTELNTMVQDRFGKASVYQLSVGEQKQIANELYHIRHIDEAQIRRCLIII